MPLPVIPGVVRCAISGQMSSLQPWTNVVHCRYSGGASSPGTSDITALDALLVRLWAGAKFGTGEPWFKLCASTITLTKTSYIVLDGSALGQDIAKTGLSGGGIGGSLPSEVAPVLTLRSNQRGRSHRGRIYMPAPDQVTIDSSGRIPVAKRDPFLVQLTGLMAALGGPAVAPFWELGVASYKLSVFTPLVTGTMDLDFDVQRRRKN